MESGGSTEVELFSYWRSSCSYRVRIALNLKGIKYEYKAVNLVKDGGEQKSEDYLKKNPQGFVPALAIDGHTLCESLPICEYLDENHTGDRNLYPTDPFLKYKCRQICEIINSGTQPLQNLAVLKKIKVDFGGDMNEWSKFYITKGLKSVEAVLADTKGKYCIGDEPTVADCFLVPQIYNANRFEVDMTQFPLINEIHENLKELQEFKDAHPDVMPDAPKDS
ncbi:unnamed protein product [Moneuplotes crassus]|uniref:Maleylacetoacetate isomerase n=1 Tax=Euplotes crassus TaxID=5936 RepID=A0AAD1XXL6_EUPCR|nr:unnamed protein product [Moneuplotes crassus]